MRARMTLVPVALLLLGCSADGETGLRLTVELPAGVGVDRLSLAVGRPGEAPAERLVPARNQNPPALESPLHVVLLVPESWGGSTLDVELAGRFGGGDVARAKLSETVEAGVVLERTVALEALCSDVCTPGASECVGDAVRLCAREGGGCARWTVPQPCPADRPYCSAGACASSCTDECSAGERRCKGGASYQACGQHDKDSCLDWGPTLGCAQGEACRPADGACVLDCGGKPCQCQPGETKACADVGECKGGVRSCENGTFGACEWKSGPQAEVCDGKDNDCNGPVDDGLVAPGCAKQAGVCAGSVRACGGLAGWKACDAAGYAAHAKSKGLVFESDETLCDEQDNDCDTETDEAPGCSCTNQCTEGATQCSGNAVQTCKMMATGCTGWDAAVPCPTGKVCQGGACVCQPDCAGKACGASDGCGGTCQSGTCPANATCQAGTCVCDHLSCGSSCCAPGQVCASGQCQQSCDVPVVVDSTGNVGLYVSLGTDAAGKVHISYHDGTNGDLKYATNAPGSWTIDTIDDTYSVGGYTSLGVDGADKVHISYRDFTNKHLKYATNGSGSWTKVVVDYGANVGEYTSLDVDGAGKIHIGYYDPQSYQLKYATNASGSWKKLVVAGGDVGEYTSLGVDGAGKIHISYFAYGVADLKYATNASGSWAADTVESTGNVGWDTSLGIDASGKVHISCYDYGNGDLKYATNASGAWKTHTVDSVADVGSYSSLGIDASGKVHISYYDETNKNLKYATNASSVWKSYLVDSAGDVGKSTSLDIDASGKVHISYYDNTQKDLKYVVMCPK